VCGCVSSKLGDTTVYSRGGGGGAGGGGGIVVYLQRANGLQLMVLVMVMVVVVVRMVDAHCRHGSSSPRRWVEECPAGR